jgi:uncharacterized protein YjbI with pentapeptide repeats/uncharacterized protein YecT (DUF1311 family)
MSLLIALALAAAAPPAGSCQAALGPLHEGVEEARLPGRVDGATIASAEALVALRRARGDALITVVGGSFAGASFNGERLTNICFIETNLAGSRWQGAEANGVGFIRANLTRADLTGAKLRGILMRESEMAGADASGADLTGGKVDGGWNGSFEGMRLDRANLTEFAFDCGITIADGCPLDRRISMRGADLTGADLADYWLESDWRGARVDRTRVSLPQLRDLGTAAIDGPVLVDGGDLEVALSPADYRLLLPAIRDANVAQSPSFDCARASSEVERRICLPIGASIRLDDRNLAILYRQAVGRDPAVADRQRAWLRERDRCAQRPDEEKDRCIAEAYERRRSELIARLGAPDWASPGAVALFVEPQVEFEESFRSTPLYTRLIPAIKGSASARVVVRVNADGSLDAAGDAVGANAHLCSLGAERLRFDPATGWFSALRSPDLEAPPQFRGKPIPVLRLFGDRAEVWRGGQGGLSEGEDPRVGDYASCGVRASFPEMIRVPVTLAEARQLFEDYEDR